MDKTHDKKMQGGEEHAPKKQTSEELRRDVGRSTLVSTIIFISVWLIVWLVAYEKGAFGPTDSYTDPIKEEEMP